MNKKITAVTLTALMVLTMFTALVPTASAVTAEKVAAPYEFFAVVKTGIDIGDTDFNLTSAVNPSVLYFDFDEGEGKESLNFRIDGPNKEINGTGDNFVYRTSIYPKDNEPYIAWLGEPYYVVENGSDWYLSKLLIDEDDDDTHLLRVGESLNLAEGFAISPLEIDVDGAEAWFSVTQDGEEVESSVVDEKTLFEYKTDLNDSGSDDNWVLKFNVETVFAGMNTNLVKINGTQLISPDVTLVETPDDETFNKFEITSEAGDSVLEIRIDDTTDEISLKKDGIVNFLGDRFYFRINEDGDVGGIVVKITEPGIYELFAEVNTTVNVGDVNFNLSSTNHPSILYYDFDEGEGKESLNFTIDGPNKEINGTGDNFVYSTSIYPKDNEPYIAWLGEPYYVVENGSDWYLSKLLIDEDDDDTHLLRVGESLNLAEGFAISPLEIDVDGAEAWFSVTQDGEEVESSVVDEKTLFEYKTDLNDSGSDDNWVLKFNVETVFAGMNTNLVKINGTQLISPDVTLVETPDDETFNKFEITSEAGDSVLEIRIDDTTDEISLKKDGTVSFLGDRFNFKINEDGDVGGVMKLVEVGDVPAPTPTGTATPTDTVDANVTATPIGTVDANVTATATTPPTPEPTPTPTKEPGFEAVFAVAGLLAVAYLVLRQRE